MRLGVGEPSMSPWEPVSLIEFAATLADMAGRPRGRPQLLSIDGRSSSGKTTLSRRISETTPSSHVVHTDDLAWHQSRFGWVDLAVEGVLRPLHAGEPVSFQPPAWRQRDRSGSIEVPADLTLVIIEGVGSSRP